MRTGRGVIVNCVSDRDRQAEPGTGSAAQAALEP